MKFYCVSDIHGHYDILISCLKDAGYDESNKNHKLLVNGDMTDRGHQSKEVLEYVYRLYKEDKAIVILGNHDDFLIELFEGNFKKTLFNYERNGHKITVDSLLGHESSEETTFKKVKDDLLNKYKHLYDFLSELPLYYELDDYIFVHGGIDVELDDWRLDTKRNLMWNKQHLMKPMPGKTIVVGHTQAVRVLTQQKGLKELYKTNPEMFDILYGEGTIHIDGSVVDTQRINVLILDI